MGYLKGPNDSHKIIIKILNETSVNYCVKFYPTIISQNKQMMLSQRPSWFLIPDPIIAQWAMLSELLLMTEEWRVSIRNQWRQWMVNHGQQKRYIWLSIFPIYRVSWHDTWPLMLSLFIPTATARAREVGYYVLLLLVIVKLEDIIINWKTALKMVIEKTQ